MASDHFEVWDGGRDYRGMVGDLIPHITKADLVGVSEWDGLTWLNPKSLKVLMSGPGLGKMGS